MVNIPVNIYLAALIQLCNFPKCQLLFFYLHLTTLLTYILFEFHFLAAVKIFRVSNTKLQILMALRTLFRNTVDGFVEYIIASKLAQVLSVGRVAYICQILEGTIIIGRITSTVESTYL